MEDGEYDGFVVTYEKVEGGWRILTGWRGTDGTITYGSEFVSHSFRSAIAMFAQSISNSNRGLIDILKEILPQ